MNKSKDNLPASDVAIAHRTEIVSGEIAAMIDNINQKAIEYQPLVKGLVDNTVSTANMAREIGILIDQLVDTLPGKEMTRDFWETKYQFFFRDAKKQLITFEMMAFFRSASRQIKKPLTAEDIQTALYYRQTLLGAAGFELEGERQPGHAHEPRSVWNEFTDLMEMEKKLQSVMQKLAQDSNYGPIEKWPKHNKESARVQLEPLKKRLDEMWRKLN